ncbi:hypothetical protein LVD15_25020 [Fulvivirga maritima]|uniref:hypothetical protein n=1 Tax=Fulvivirga maritima TaxID=2904247 RepID=UPI001F221A0D|nr:hypothetical protein [Fulvivirga maritima]UII26520.1 hypothetical protein LVD15_25020 [Fulvivirga maritima]
MEKNFLTHQIDFFRDIKDNHQLSSSLPAIIAEILNISIDSAYRRMRGETPLILPELIKICDHFNASFSYGKNSSNELSLFYKSLCNDEQPLKDLIGCFVVLRANLTRLLKHENAMISLTLTDLPIFYLANYRTLTNFRIKVWFKEMIGRDITIAEGYDKAFEELLEVLQDTYKLMKSSLHREIWSHQSIHDLLGSISYHYQTGEISEAESIQIFSELDAFLTDVYDYANTSSNCEMYMSETELTNSYMLCQGGEEKLSIIKMFSINSMFTFDPTLYDDIKMWIDLIINNSVLINNSNRKQRHLYFSILRDQVFQKREMLGVMG